MTLLAAVAAALAIDAGIPAHIPAASTSSTSKNEFGLSSREHDVLKLLCERWTDPEIAERLSISQRTVSSHVSSIFSKLGVNTRRAAAAMAAREDLL